MVTELGFPRLIIHLVSSKDFNVREAALRCILELAYVHTPDIDNILHGENEKLKELLKNRIDHITKMSDDDLSAAREERQLIDSLWQAMFDEPSTLREKGLVVLPGEDAPASSPQHSAFAAPQSVQESNTSNKKKEIPLLLGP